MKLLGIVVAVFGLASIGVGAVSHHPVLYLLAGFSLIAAITTYRAAGISTFLQGPDPLLRHRDGSSRPLRFRVGTGMVAATLWMSFGSRARWR